MNHFENWIYLGLAVGLLAAVILGAAKSAERRRDARMRHVREIAARAPELFYWVRNGGQDYGPLTIGDILDFYAAGKLGLEAQIAPDAPQDQRQYRPLGDEIPSLRKLKQTAL